MSESPKLFNSFRCTLHQHIKDEYTIHFISVPTIKIVDERHQKVENQIFYDLGSTIKLKCMVENIVGEQPEYIIWKKGNRMLNYDTERGGIRLLVIWYIIWCIFCSIWYIFSNIWCMFYSIW